MGIATLNHREHARGIRLQGVCYLTAFSRATVWRKVKYDPGFPRPFKLSQGVTVWDEAEILDWIESKKVQQRALVALAAQDVGDLALQRLLDDQAQRQANRIAAPGT